MIMRHHCLPMSIMYTPTTYNLKTINVIKTRILLLIIPKSKPPTNIWQKIINAPRINPRWKDEANWPDAMSEEIGADKGLSSAGEYRQRMWDSFQKQREIIDDFDPDFIIWLDTAKEYRKYFPPESYKIILVGNELWFDLASELPFWDEVLPVNVKAFKTLSRYRWTILNKVRSFGAEIAIQPTFSCLLYTSPSPRDS